MKAVKRILSMMLAVSLLSASVVYDVNADAVPVVTLGADLSEQQKELVLSFFGTDENSVSVLEVNNQQERKYLEGLVSNDIIGTRTLSCAYILPTSSGGIVVKTANLSWVTDAMLANSLLTCGVENCQVIATAPFEVSGTGALTGVMLAYESSSGETLEEAKKELATEELVITGELIDSISEDDELTSVVEEQNDIENADSVEISKYVIDMLNDMKTEALNGNLSEESAKKIVDAYLEQYKLDLSEEMKQKLVDYIMTFSSERYEKGFKESLDSLTERIKDGFDINISLSADESLSWFQKVWQNFVNWIKKLFGKLEDETSDVTENIFDNVNTDIISYDEAPEGTEEDADEKKESVTDETQVSDEQPAESEEPQSQEEKSESDQEEVYDEADKEADDTETEENPSEN